MRRKLEEAKKNALSSPPLQQVQPAPTIVAPTIQNTPVQSEIVPSKVDIEPKPTTNPPKQSIQTQTSRLVDSCVQTTLDLAKKVLDSNSESESVQNFENEIPTRDSSHKLTIENVKQKEKINKSKMISSSPIKRSESRGTHSSRDSTGSTKSTTSTNLINSSVDLTRVSNISEQFLTPVYSNPPRPSNSPVNFAQHTKFERNVSKRTTQIDKKSVATTSSTITSTISSISSSITNITLPESNEKQNLIGSRADLDKTITCSTNENFSSNNLAAQNTYDKINEYLNANYKTYDDSDYESDEILQILFKKTYYYQMKLK